MQNIKISIQSKQKQYDFDFVVHAANNSAEQRIEKEFYLQYAGALHAGLHHEIQVVTPSILEHSFYQRGFVNPSKLHIHRSKNFVDEHYVCWTGRLATSNDVAIVAALWATATVYTIECGEDFVELFEKHKIDPSDHVKVLSVLQNEYGIQQLVCSECA